MTLQAMEFGAGQEAGATRPRELPLIPGNWILAVLAASSLVVAALMIASRLTIAAASWGLAGLLGLACGLALLWYRTRHRPTPLHGRLREFAEHTLVFLAIAVLGAVANYSAASRTSGFDDALLERADRMLHFDWVVLYEVVLHHPVLQVLGAAAYASVYVSPLLLLGALSWTGRRAQARHFLMTFWLSVVLTLLLFPLFPARGAMAFLWHGPIPYMPTNGLYQGVIIAALRAHTMTAIDFASLHGLVCAPSFHTVCAIVYMSAAWPVPGLRRLLVPVNLAMLAATPVEGMHYLVDMLMGLGVAITAILMVRAGTGRLAQRMIEPAIGRLRH